MPDWNSELYLKFVNERTLPAIDLIRHIAIDEPHAILDVGCGPGYSTHLLAQRFPQADILGIDNSCNMIEQAKKAHPSLSFALCDAGTQLETLPAGYDIVFSNACLQWIPNHPALLQTMMGRLRKGGILAVQIPEIYEEPIHRILVAVAASPRWAATFSGIAPFHHLAAGGYYDLLSAISSGFSMWQTTYFHTMKSHQEIMEWYRSTGFKPYLDKLNGAEALEFEQGIYSQLVQAYPLQKNGDIIFRFPRLFFTAFR